jgi:hypothetical protein
VSTYGHLFVNGEVDNSTVSPSSNCSAPIHQRVLRILKLQHRRPREVVNAIDDPLQDRIDCGSFLGDTLLALIIKWTVETV